MKKNRILVLLVLSLIVSNAFAQKINSYEIDIEFFPEDASLYGDQVSNESFVRGKTTVDILDLASKNITFYLHGELSIDSIISNNKKIDFNFEKVIYAMDYSMVALKTVVNFSDLKPNRNLTVYYSGFFNPSKSRSLSDYMYININSGIYLRSYGYSLWFPVFIETHEEPYDSNFKSCTIKTPKRFKSIVNGDLLSEVIENDIRITTWKPGIINISELQIAASKYHVLNRDNIYIYYLNNEQIANDIIDFIQKIKQIYSSSFKKSNENSVLYIIELPKYGNISSQNVIGISESVFANFNQNISSMSTIAHELVHSYLKIPIEMDNPFYVFVVEGFPSFFHFYGMKRTLNKNVFDLDEVMKNIEKNYLNKIQTGLDSRGYKLPSNKPILKIKPEEIGLYKDYFILNDRVRLFFYGLWKKMGDSNFNEFLKELFQFSSIRYSKFEELVLKYIPNYEEELNVWLNTIDYPEMIRIKD